MNDPELIRLFEDERQRLFTPRADFCRRVMLRLDEKPLPQTTIWETALDSMRPITAAALILIAALLGLQVFQIPEPNRGPIQIALDLEIPDIEQMLYLEANPPESVVLEELIVVGME